jgi:hypothetical protein
LRHRHRHWFGRGDWRGWREGDGGAGRSGGFVFPPRRRGGKGQGNESRLGRVYVTDVLGPIGYRSYRRSRIRGHWKDRSRSGSRRSSMIRRRWYAPRCSRSDDLCLHYFPRS